MTDPPPASKRNAGKASTADSKSINKDATSKMLFISGHKDVVDVSVFENKLKSELVGQEDHGLIERISPPGGGTLCCTSMTRMPS